MLIEKKTFIQRNRDGLEVLVQHPIVCRMLSDQDLLLKEAYFTSPFSKTPKQERNMQERVFS